jgi:hypothetical protein
MRNRGALAISVEHALLWGADWPTDDGVRSEPIAGAQIARTLAATIED